MSAEIAGALRSIQFKQRLSSRQLAITFEASLASITRWMENTATPSPETSRRILEMARTGTVDFAPTLFASTGINLRSDSKQSEQALLLSSKPGLPILDRLYHDGQIMQGSAAGAVPLWEKHSRPAETRTHPPLAGVSAGKNTYTYDAHTYHTKVPPQGIAEIMRHYLPDGGLVLDPYAGSGMTGVAAQVTGNDCLLNELSPAACFISNRFTSRIDPQLFDDAVAAIVEDLRGIRNQLFSTTCRECGNSTEIRYTVWAYRVTCPLCDHDFNIWDACRKYGRTVRDHKILTEFPCPACTQVVKKRTLARTAAEPVSIGYICCGNQRTEVTRPPLREDLDLIASTQEFSLAVDGWFPTTPLPDGVNLGQPKKHGLDSVDKFYTARSLAALSHVWRSIHRISDLQTAAFAAFVFTSLYRRVSKFSEFRFWGGSGNSARLNVPYIFEEQNVFLSFERKAKTIRDHLVTTATGYSGLVAVREGSASDLSGVPDESIDFIFTDPPFGANINYSEMNLLWESWLGHMTDPTEEAIINKVQGKGLDDYASLMKAGLNEAYRVLRPGHWMALVFMNSSASVWSALEQAITASGFVIVKADIFDKQHGTFKHFVAPNTAGADLVLHCLRPRTRVLRTDRQANEGVNAFLDKINVSEYRQGFLHVRRDDEMDLRRMYSEWIAQSIIGESTVIDFTDFRSAVQVYLSGNLQ